MIKHGLDYSVVVKLQIFDQVSDAYSAAGNANIIVSVLKTVFNREMSGGRRLRNKTKLLEEP